MSKTPKQQLIGEKSSGPQQKTHLELGKEYFDQAKYDEAFDHFRKGAMGTIKFEYGQCQFYLFIMYHNGLGVVCDREEANDWLQRGMKNEDASCMASYGDMCRSSINPRGKKEAFEWYYKAAEKGHRLSQYTIGKMYEKGEGVPQSYKDAMKWYLKAAEQCCAKSQYEIAKLYYHGKGVKRDYAKVMKWALKSSANRYAGADSLIGSMYYDGEGVPQDYSKAIEWFKKAADVGDPMALFNLGTMYVNGEGVKLDPIKAIDCFIQAEASGNDEIEQSAREQILLLVDDHAEVLAEYLRKVDNDDFEEDFEDFDEKDYD